MVITQVVRPGQLTARELARWSRLQRADQALFSPFFRPEFTLAVADCRSDVEVAVLRTGTEPVGFFPFHRTGRNVGIPVAGPMSDYHGLIARADLRWDAEQLVRDCGLAAWHFSHLIASQEPFRPYHCIPGESPFMDLSRGFDAYYEASRRAGSRTLSQAMRKLRKLDREIGAVRFQPHTADPRVFKMLLDWKRQQYRSTKAKNYLAPRWTVELLENVRHLEDAALAGMFSVLWAGERPVAVHLGLRSHDVLHIWFPAYDPAFARYSPGLIMWLKLAETAADLKIRRIDLGKGDERYKSSLQSGTIPLAEGSVDRRPVAGSLRRRYLRTREWVRSSRLRRPLRFVVCNARTWLGRSY